MKYGSPAAFRTALEVRLKKEAAGNQQLLNRLRKRVVFDRFLARMVSTFGESFLLKGGFAIDLRLAGRERTTEDIDIEWREDPDELADALLDAAELDLDDHFSFSVSRLRTDEPEAFGGSHRYRLAAEVAGRRFEDVILDCGFRAQPTAGTVPLRTPGRLAFAGLEPVTVQAIALEQQLAEKLHAYTRVYEGGRVSTRSKDLIDMALAEDEFSLDAAALHASITAIFDARGTHEPPTALPEPPTLWEKPYAEQAGALGLEPDVARAHHSVAAMLDPMLAGTVTSGAWDPDTKRWTSR